MLRALPSPMTEIEAKLAEAERAASEKKSAITPDTSPVNLRELAKSATETCIEVIRKINSTNSES